MRILTFVHLYIKKRGTKEYARHGIGLLTAVIFNCYFGTFLIFISWLVRVLSDLFIILLFIFMIGVLLFYGCTHTKNTYSLQNQ